MKFFPKTEANIIEFPDRPIFLSRQEGNHYVYEIRYLANPKLVLQLKAFEAVIKVSEESLKLKKSEKVFDRYNPERINQKLQTKSSKDLDAAHSSNNKILFAKTSDITSRIQKAAIQAIRNQDSPVVNNRLVVKPVRKRDADGQNLKLPILERNKPTINEQDSSQKEIRQQFLQQLQQNNDPSEQFNKTNSTVASAKSVEGTGKYQNSSKLQRAFLNSNLLSSQDQLTDGDFIPALIREDIKQFEIREEIKIPINFIASEFYVVIDVLNEKELILNRISTAVKHLEHIELLSIPKKQPKVSRKYIPASGRTLLTVQQMDENAEGVELFRRTINKSVPNQDAIYQSITKIPLQHKEVATVEDKFPTSNYLIYRVVPYDVDDQLTSIYTGVLSGNQSINIPGKSKNPKQFNPKNLFLIPNIVDDGVEITLHNVPSSVAAVQLLRRNLSTYEKRFSSIKKPFYLGGNDFDVVNLTDEDVKNNRVYEYACKLITKQGDELTASDTKVVEFVPIQSNVLRLRTSNPVVTEEEELDIQFTIHKEIIQNDFDVIKNTLQQQGLSSEYLDEIKNSREKLQQLFVVRVVRYDLTTGAEEDFGVIQSLEFSDKNFGRVKSVQPLISGHQYRYMLYAYTRDVETLFEGLEKTTQTSENGSYTYKPYKWRNPVILREGNITTETSLRRNYGKNLTLGEVVDISSIDIGTSREQPIISEASARRIRSNEILVRWKFEGDIDLVDHFVVVLENMGLRKIEGKSHAINTTDTFRVVDVLDDGETGLLTYLIYPVLYDFSRGEEAKTNSILV